MGSGVSSSPGQTPEPQMHDGYSYQQNGKPTATTKPLGDTLVRTSQVAPIIIKNCKEEFQHVSEIKEPIVYGRIAETMPEHALVRNRYFLVRDVDCEMDASGARTPEVINSRKCRGELPVYGMGQPTYDGLRAFMNKLKHEGHQDILLVQMRREPVLFVREQLDLLPYSPRHQDHLKKCDTDLEADPYMDISRYECIIRKEILDLAALLDKQHFFFYNDINQFKDEPHMYRTAYEDDLAVTEEIYARLTFNNSGISYLRLPLVEDRAPLEEHFDAVLNQMKHVPRYFEKQSKRIPALVFTSHKGVNRATVGMVIGGLVLAHKAGFPQEAVKSPYPINEKSPNLERGEFHVIQQLARYLPRGLHVKQEVDAIIDQCGQLMNLRTAIMESKRLLEDATDEQDVHGEPAKEYYLQQCTTHLERYYYLICFNAYLHEQYCQMFGEPFSMWFLRQPELCTMLRYMDISERKTPINLISSDQRYLVADDYLGLDVLSSQMDVKTSNFRRVPGFPVYGTAQPSREGLSCMVNHLLHRKQGHPLVVIVNLRDDLVIECNGATYCVRDKLLLEEPILMPGITAREIEEREELLKKEIKSKKTYQVYQEVDRAAETLEFQSVLTCVDMVEQLKMQTKELQYHRLPIQDDVPTPEGVFDELLSLVLRLDELHRDEDGPALVMQCRTGKGRTTTAMAIVGLIICHQKGFPYGTKPGEEERVSLPNAKYTQGNYQIVSEVVRRLPNGQQMKREVDFILNQCSDTMTPMHYHLREVIFVTYNKSKKAKTEAQRLFYRKRSLDYLERYIYLILFNAYLHCERRNKWKTSFRTWMKEVAAKAGMYAILNNMSFQDFEPAPCELTKRRARCTFNEKKTPFRGNFC